MAKRFKNNNDKKLERAVMRNWIICGATLGAIIVLTIISRAS